MIMTVEGVTIVEGMTVYRFKTAFAGQSQDKAVILAWLA
jgi:hypothetical protein